MDASTASLSHIAECQTPFWCEKLGAGASKARERLCLRGEQLCDGVYDCPDKVDETTFCRECGVWCGIRKRRPLKFLQIKLLLWCSEGVVCSRLVNVVLSRQESIAMPYGHDDVRELAALSAQRLALRWCTGLPWRRR